MAPELRQAAGYVKAAGPIDGSLSGLELVIIPTLGNVIFSQ
jgi:hypothetical protein